MAHGSSKEKLETVESQLSDARQEQDPTCNGMHDMVAFLDGACCRPMILKGAGFDLKTLYVPFRLISLPDSSLPTSSSKSERSTSITVSEQGGRQVDAIL
jgi:hypothetical protein